MNGIRRRRLFRAPFDLFPQIGEVAQIGEELLFPVYREPIVGSGSGAEYNIIGWVGFVPTSYNLGGNSGTIRGYFTKVIWQGIADDTGSVPDFGVRQDR